MTIDLAAIKARLSKWQSRVGHERETADVVYSAHDVPALVSLVEKIARLAYDEQRLDLEQRYYAIVLELKNAGITPEVVAGLEKTHG